MHILHILHHSVRPRLFCPPPLSRSATVITSYVSADTHTHTHARTHGGASKHDLFCVRESQSGEDVMLCAIDRYPYFQRCVSAPVGVGLVRIRAVGEDAELVSRLRPSRRGCDGKQKPLFTPSDGVGLQ